MSRDWYCREQLTRPTVALLQRTSIGLQTTRLLDRETALLKLINDVYVAADNEARTLRVQLDLPAAFDSVNTAPAPSGTVFRPPVLVVCEVWRLSFSDNCMHVRGPSVVCTWPTSVFIGRRAHRQGH